jgi:hypothetical protein
MTRHEETSLSERRDGAASLHLDMNEQAHCLQHTDVIALQMERSEMQREHMYQLLAGSPALAHKPWFLMTIHNPLEHAPAQQLAEQLRCHCHAVILVRERYPNDTVAAALALHRLHFPHIPEQERKGRILFLTGKGDGNGRC